MWRAKAILSKYKILKAAMCEHTMEANKNAKLATMDKNAIQPQRIKSAESASRRLAECFSNSSMMAYMDT
ncbi:hypothetical protein D3C75_1111460 [compost metagenome]